MNDKLPLTSYDYDRIPLMPLLIVGAVLIYDHGQMVLLIADKCRDEILRLLNENCPELVSRILS